MAEQLPSKEKFKDDFGRKIDPRSQCPNGVLHDFRQARRGKEKEGKYCIKCGLTKEFIDYLLKCKQDGPKKCACGKADSGFCLVCNRECPACHSKMYNGVCVYCDGKDYSDM